MSTASSTRQLTATTELLEVAFRQEGSDNDVAAHGLAHTEHGEIHSEQLLSFFLVVVPVLWVWAGHTLFANRYDVDSIWQRF